MLKKLKEYSKINNLLVFYETETCLKILKTLPIEILNKSIFTIFSFLQTT